MTKQEAREYVENHRDDDNLDREEVEAAFSALYGRRPDIQDRRDGVWSLCCAAVED